MPLAPGLHPAWRWIAPDRPHISYYDPANGDLKYAHRTAAGWEVQVVDQPGDVGMSSALALDVEDRPVIAYHDATAGILKYAWWTGKGWLLQELDRIGSLSPSYISLALEADGTPHVAYYDVDAGDLKYAHSRYPIPVADWEITTVDSVGDVGGYNSLACNEAGIPRISYVDWTNSTLKYAELTQRGVDPPDRDGNRLGGPQFPGGWRQRRCPPCALR